MDIRTPDEPITAEMYARCIGVLERLTAEHAQTLLSVTITRDGLHIQNNDSAPVMLPINVETLQDNRVIGALEGVPCTLEWNPYRNPAVGAHGVNLNLTPLPLQEPENVTERELAQFRRQVERRYGLAAGAGETTAVLLARPGIHAPQFVEASTVEPESVPIERMENIEHSTPKPRRSRRRRHKKRQSTTALIPPLFGDKNA